MMTTFQPLSEPFMPPAGQAQRRCRPPARPLLPAVLLACTLSMASLAQAGGPAGGVLRASADAVTTTSGTVQPEAASAGAYGPKKLLETYMAYGPGSVPITSTGVNTVLNTSTVTCPNNASCTIGLESTVQLHPLNGNWAICLWVDSISPSCQLQGTWGGGGNGIVVGNARGAVQNLAPGPHTVTTEARVLNWTASTPYTVYFFHTDYRIYKQ